MSRMEELIEEKPGVNFYVATDDPGTENKLKQHFGNRIRSIHHKHLSLLPAILMRWSEKTLRYFLHDQLIQDRRWHRSVLIEE